MADVELACGAVMSILHEHECECAYALDAVAALDGARAARLASLELNGRGDRKKGEGQGGEDGSAREHGESVGRLGLFECRVTGRPG